MDSKTANWRELNRQLNLLFVKDIVEMQKKRLLTFFSVKKSSKLEITKNIQKAFLEFINEQPKCAFMNTQNAITQSILQLEQEIKVLELSQLYDSYPSYSKVQLKTANAELETFEYWLYIVSTLAQDENGNHDYGNGN